MNQSSNNSGWIIILIVVAIWLFRRKKSKLPKVPNLPSVNEATKVEQSVAPTSPKVTWEPVIEKRKTTMSSSQSVQPPPVIDHPTVLTSTKMMDVKPAIGTGASMGDGLATVAHTDTKSTDFAIPKQTQPNWIRHRVKVKINKYEISAGHIYVLNSQSEESSKDPSCINPSLHFPAIYMHNVNDKIVFAVRYSDPADNKLSYNNLSFAQRIKYLKWLADNRKPHVSLEYVLLFVMGLERRLLVDLLTSVDALKELPSILSELESLCSEYSSDSSPFELNFHKRIRELLTTIRLQQGFNIPFGFPRLEYIAEQPIDVRYWVASCGFGVVSSDVALMALLACDEVSRASAVFYDLDALREAFRSVYRQLRPTAYPKLVFNSDVVYQPLNYSLEAVALKGKFVADLTKPNQIVEFYKPIFETAIEQMSAVSDAQHDEIVSGSGYDQVQPKTSQVIEIENQSPVATSDVVSSTTSTPNQIERRWLTKGENITIHGIGISDGLIYTGSAFSSDWQTEPSCIVPDEQISEPLVDRKKEGIGYYPSYDQLTPTQRYIYLKWLSEGRKDPEIDIGYVFIFFYGLERRIVVDTVASTQPTDEVTAIIEEVRRLIAIYNTNHSFQRYANRFLEFISLKCAPQLLKFDPNSLELSGYVPVALKSKLAEIAGEGKPLPADIALSWYLQSGQSYLTRTSEFSKCRSKYERLFNLIYAKKHGKGLKLTVSKRQFTLEYTAANRSLFYADRKVKSYHSDIAYESTVLEKIGRILEACDDQLSAYRRFVGRKPDEAHSINALSLLPREVLTEERSAIVHNAEKWMRGKSIESQFMKATRTDLFKELQVAYTDKISKAESVAIVTFLDKLRIGIEPDIRFSGHRLIELENVILFELDDKAETAPTENYSFAIFFLELAVSVSESDDQAAEVEKKHLQAWINSIKEFTKSEKKRLNAHLEWLFIEKPELSGVKKKIGLLSAEQKEAFISILIEVANIDGKIEPQEIKMLQKVYGWMSVDKERLFSDMHSYQSDGIDHQPVTIFKGNAKSKSNFAIPPKVDQTSVVLNQAKIEKKLKETKKVNKLLSEVFAEEETQVEPVKVANEQKVKGLDKLHTDLVMELVKKPTWVRSDFETLCQSKGLFADGAMEMINEAAYGIADQPLLEEDAEIAVISDVAKAMQLL